MESSICTNFTFKNFTK